MGYVKKLSMNDDTITDFGRVGSLGPFTIQLKDDSSLFVASCGNLKMVSAQHGMLIKDFGEIHLGGIRASILTDDQEFLFTTEEAGRRNLKQHYASEQGLFKDHGDNIFSEPIFSLAL